MMNNTSIRKTLTVFNIYHSTLQLKLLNNLRLLVLLRTFWCLFL